MIPRPQHFGDRAPFPFFRSGIVRIFEKPRLEALLLSAGGRAHYPGKQPHASIEDDHRAKLSARQDIVADRRPVRAAALRKSARQSPRSGRTAGRRPRRPQAPERGPGSAAPRAASAPASAGRPRRCRARRQARPAEAPSPPRRPPACRRRSDACRSRSRGCWSHRGSRCPRRAPARRDLSPSGPGNISG